jgi:hypothetical protein
MIQGDDIEDGEQFLRPPPRRGRLLAMPRDVPDRGLLGSAAGVAAIMVMLAIVGLWVALLLRIAT